VGIAAAIIGPGWKEGVAYVAFPIMGGGLGAGVLPMAEIFGSISQMDSTEILSILIPAMALGNVFAIIGGAVLNKIGEIKPSLTGNGKLLKNDQQMDTKQDKKELSFKALGVGLFVSCVFLIFGRILSKFIPGIHYYALMIISVALCKVFNLIPKDIEDACSVWFQFVAKYMTAPLLVGVGVTYTDLGVVIDALTIQNIILVIAVVAGAIVGAGFGGKLVGFFFVESALSAGLCMANMGGTGDVAVLSAAKRMELIPFAQISSRLGGALMLILAGVVMPLLM
jgi:Na+/citrate or Na+/malate symporter